MWHTPKLTSHKQVLFYLVIFNLFNRFIRNFYKHGIHILICLKLTLIYSSHVFHAIVGSQWRGLEIVFEINTYLWLEQSNILTTLLPLGKSETSCFAAYCVTLQAVRPKYLLSIDYLAPDWRGKKENSTVQVYHTQVPMLLLNTCRANPGRYGGKVRATS
jgi:hypothetical protein